MCEDALSKGQHDRCVEIPVKNPASGTVAVMVKTDGAEIPMKQSIATENGVILPLDGNAVIKIADRSQHFVDVGHW